MKKLPFATSFSRKNSIQLGFKGLLVLGDLCSVYLGYWISFLLRFEFKYFVNLFPEIQRFPLFSEYSKTFPLVVFIWFILMALHGLYRRINSSALDEFIQIFQSAIISTIVIMSLLFLYRDFSYSRLVFLIGGVLATILVYAERELLKFLYLVWIQSTGRQKRVLLLGKGHLASRIKRILRKHGDRVILQIERLERDKIEKILIRSRIDEVYMADSLIDQSMAIQIGSFCDSHQIEFRMLPNILELRMGEVQIDDSLGIPIFRLKPLSLDGTSFLIKRTFDISISSFLFSLFIVPGLIIAMLIKLSSAGPVFFIQERVGLNEKKFRFIKFRTMVANAEDLVETLEQKNDRNGPAFKMKNDPRITWIGRFLRRFSLDEFPQIINVIKGDMSLVGPRPQVLKEAEGNYDWAKKRFNVLPGITGLWQVSGRADLTYEEMMELDIYYIEHWSLGLDLKILIKTVPAVLAGKGAY